jgi:hypothetical protein
MHPQAVPLNRQPVRLADTVDRVAPAVVHPLPRSSGCNAGGVLCASSSWPQCNAAWPTHLTGSTTRSTPSPTTAQFLLPTLVAWTTPHSVTSNTRRQFATRGCSSSLACRHFSGVHLPRFAAEVFSLSSPAKTVNQRGSCALGGRIRCRCRWLYLAHVSHLASTLSIAVDDPGGRLCAAHNKRRHVE